jgi:hypothetical protein
MTVTGQVEGATFSSNISGKFMNFKDRVYYSEHARANLLSLSRVWEQFKVRTDSVTKSFKVILSENSYLIFCEINHLFICNIQNDIIGDHKIMSFISQVETNKEKYTK